MSLLTATARAKINLTLRVVGRRADGYHLLDSLVAFTDLGDGLTVETADSLSLVLTGPFASELTAESDNLVLRAARALAPDRGARITLDKRLPIASGIGGGSADAAAALLLLDELWGLSTPPDRLHQIALSLGADVPVCLAGRPARMGGIGDELLPAPELPAAALVLVNPRIACPTPKVFGARTGSFSLPMLGVPDRISDVSQLASLIERGGNDLSRAAMSLVPEIASALSAMRHQAGCYTASLSGSGATSFALFADLGGANNAAAAIKGERPNWWVAATRLST
ncbi:4-(cytidine 5'-diphospho)-2-C-methyl-D-erythritol kinase [Lacibacterium aquatile]|uniref:4-diphosphocytidyl-2-C-methyl-D-erythritol kinase n=1 Tax=Lacibacterium aquatile TaxID=1168082 RepID=A0ABW5DMU1_9PROT